MTLPFDDRRFAIQSRKPFRNRLTPINLETGEYNVVATRLPSRPPGIVLSSDGDDQLSRPRAWRRVQKDLPRLSPQTDRWMRTCHRPEACDRQLIPRANSILNIRYPSFADSFTFSVRMACDFRKEQVVDRYVNKKTSKNSDAESFRYVFDKYVAHRRLPKT